MEVNPRPFVLRHCVGKRVRRWHSLREDRSLFGRRRRRNSRRRRREGCRCSEPRPTFDSVRLLDQESTSRSSSSSSPRFCSPAARRRCCHERAPSPCRQQQQKRRIGVSPPPGTGRTTSVLSAPPTTMKQPTTAALDPRRMTTGSRGRWRHGRATERWFRRRRGETAGDQSIGHWRWIQRLISFSFEL